MAADLAVAAPCAAGLESLQLSGMGSQVHLLLLQPPAGAADHATARLGELEARWSRFRADSELACLGRAGGGWTPVSSDSLRLLTRMREAWQHTDGRFDPTVHDRMAALGYDRTWGDVAGTDEPTTDVDSAVPGLAGLELDGAGRVRLPDGVRLDPGAIGKGFAADLLADELLALGVAGGLVNVGGDLRVFGQSPDGEGWGVAAAGAGDRPVARLALAAGGVATSVPSRRQWQRGGERLHHVLDPRTGRPVRFTLDSVTVVAGEAWRAEVLATAMLLSAPDEWRGLLAPWQGAALVVDGGQIHQVGPIEEYLR